MSSHYFRLVRRGAIDHQRSPLLERLLARSDSSTAVTDWRADAFRIIAPAPVAMPAIAPAALWAERGFADAAARAAWVFLATPVNYLAEMANVRLPADGILSLRRPEAEALAADFNRLWAEAGIRLLAGRDADLFCIFDRTLDVTTHDPEHVLDQPIADHLPHGAAAPLLRRLMSELEMWLFEHPVNRARTSQAVPAVNGLWLWGGGPALTTLPPVPGWTTGFDPLFKAWAARAEGARPGDDGSGARAGSGVAVIAAPPGTSEWRDEEPRLLGRSAADLNSGRISRLYLSARDRCFSVSRRARWRFWRRVRPWWESFE